MLGANAGGLAAAVVAGMALTEARGATLPFEPPAAAEARIFWLIFLNNAGVLLSLVAGAATLGIYTSLALLWNGYFLGVVLCSLRREAPEVLPRAAPYITLEFAALLLGASAAWVLVVDGVGCLAANRPLRIQGVAAVLALAIVLLLAAAWFEVRFIDGDFSLWETSFD